MPLLIRWLLVPAVDAIEVALAGLAAFGIVVTTSAVAPAHKRHVAIATYVAGAAFALFVVAHGNMIGPFTGAAIGGTAAPVLGLRRGGRWHALP